MNLNCLPDLSETKGVPNQPGDLLGILPLSRKSGLDLFSPKKLKAPERGEFNNAPDERKLIIYHKIDFAIALKHSALVHDKCHPPAAA